MKKNCILDDFDQQITVSDGGKGIVNISIGTQGVLVSAANTNKAIKNAIPGGVKPLEGCSTKTSVSEVNGRPLTLEVCSDSDDAKLVNLHIGDNSEKAIASQLIKAIAICK